MSTTAVIAHRGVTQGAPENTLAAFERAVVLGADGIELDVHRTADGAVVVHHDATPRWRPGEPEGLPRPFFALTLAEVRRLRVGDGHSIPTLAEVLEAVGESATVYCELKGEAVVEAAAPLLARRKGPCAMHSFDHRVLVRAAALAPGVPRGILLVSRLVDTAHALSAARASTLWPQLEFVDASLVAEVRATGGQVVVWTANDPRDIRRLAGLGVDGICTDDVAAAREALHSTFPPFCA